MYAGRTSDLTGPNGSRAFISIIALLIALLLPALGTARESANLIKCQSGERQLVFATTLYTEDNEQYYPEIECTSTCAASDWEKWWPKRIKPYLGGLSEGPNTDRNRDNEVFYCSVKLGDNPKPINTYTVNGAFWMFRFSQYGGSLGDYSTRVGDVKSPGRVVVMFESVVDLLDTHYKPDPLTGGGAHPGFSWQSVAPYHAGRHFFGGDAGNGSPYGWDNIGFADGHVASYELKEYVANIDVGYMFNYPFHPDNAFIRVPVPRDGPPGPLGEFWFPPTW